MIVEKILFLQWLESKKLKPRTIEDYTLYLDKLDIYAAFNQEMVNAFLSQKSNNNKIARAFIQHYKDFLWINKDQLKIQDSDVTKIKEIVIPKIKAKKSNRLVKYILESEVLKLEESMKKERNKLMVLITFYGGLRVGELLSLKPKESFNWKEWVPGERGKIKVPYRTKTGERIVFLPSKVMGRLKHWIETYQSIKNPDPNKPLFNLSIRRWEELIRQAGRRILGKDITPHVLRHSLATHLLNHGMNIRQVQEILGHSSITSTQIYTHISEEELGEKFSEIFS